MIPRQYIEAGCALHDEMEVKPGNHAVNYTHADLLKALNAERTKKCSPILEQCLRMIEELTYIKMIWKHIRPYFRNEGRRGNYPGDGFYGLQTDSLIGRIWGLLSGEELSDRPTFTKLWREYEEI